MEGELGVLQVERKIRGRVKRQMEKTQREYYLNEQMKAIQSELGGGDGEETNELAELQGKIDKLKLSKEARAKANVGAQEAQDDAADVAPRRPSSATISMCCSACPGARSRKLKKDIAARAGGAR